MLIGQKMDKSLIGIGGVRLLRVPGVQHDRKVVLPTPGMNQDTGEPYDEVPVDSISTREASQLLKCTQSAARQVLVRRGVERYIVRRAQGGLESYWEREAVERLAELKLPIQQQIPQKMMTAEAASRKLKISRSSLYRYVQMGQLQQIKRRMPGRLGMRITALYLSSEVAELYARLNALKKKKMGGLRGNSWKVSLKKL